MDKALSLAQIKRIRSLQQKKFRAETSLFVVEGEKLALEALNSDFEVESIWRKDQIGEKAMERISSLSSPSPVLAVVRQKTGSLSDIALEKGRLYLMLDGVKDPGNMGTIIRLADWFGVSAVFCSPECVELYNPKTVQATMGAIFRVPVVYCNLSEVVSKASAASVPVFGTFLDGSPVNADFCCKASEGSIIVMGSESNGISDELSLLINKERHILIPSYDVSGKAKPARSDEGSESLNVATACAAILSLIRAR
ncbi:MAG: RNA methyltransferase [Bacteroidales bacterium]|nr:RNA methyltransferase [Bacteroidales bacterium]